MRNYQELLAAHAARFQGIIEGPQGNLILFRDLHFGTTLALPESGFCSEAIARRLADSRSLFSGSK